MALLTQLRRLFAAVALPIALASPLAAETIRLSTGETLNVQMLSLNEESIRFIHPVLGELTLPRASVEVLPPPPPSEAPAAPAQQPLGVEEPATPAPTPAPPPPPPPPTDWKFKFTLAGAYTTGNTDATNFTTALTGLKETSEMRTTFDLAYYYAQTSGDRSENRFTAGGKNDWLNPDSKWFWWADARYDFDEFQAWDYRIQAHTGPGYHFKLPPPLRLDGLAGLGFVKEFNSDNDDWRPEALTGLDGKWDISKRQALTFSTYLYPDLGDLGEYRWTNAAEWTCLLDEATKLNLTAGLKHEYQSQVDDDVQHNDLRVYVGLQLDF